MTRKLFFIAVMLIGVSASAQVVEHPTTSYQYDQKAYTVNNYIDAMKKSLYTNIDDEVINSGSLKYSAEYTKFLQEVDAAVAKLFKVYEVKDTVLFKLFTINPYVILDGSSISEDWFNVAPGNDSTKIGEYGLLQRADIIARRLDAASKSPDAKDVKNTEAYKSLEDRQAELLKIIDELSKAKTK